MRDRNGNLKGTDFLHFYTLGLLAIEHRGDALYDMNAQSAVVAQRVSEAAGIRYLPLYPPQVSLLFAPLAHLSYGKALALWWICSALIYAACCYGIWRVCPNLRCRGRMVCLLAVAYPAFFHLIAWGQTSALALACFTGFFLLVRRGHEVLAGVILGCLVFKPQLGLAAGVVLVFVGAWRILAGTVPAAVAQLSAGVFHYGWDPLRLWIRSLWNIQHSTTLLEPRPYQTHCLRSFWSMLIPWGTLPIILYAISAAVVLAFAMRVWKRSRDWAPRFSLLLVATVLVAPHLTVYDLVILAPAFLLLADWLLSQQETQTSGILGVLLYLVYTLPLLGFLSQWTHVQLSVLAMSFLVYQIWKAVRCEDRLHDSSTTAKAGVA